MRKASKAELVNHPVRMRILGLFGKRRLTTRQICDTLPEVPQATVYRQIKVLLDGGILEIVGKRQAHGVVEQTYAMVQGSARFSREEFAGMTADEHRSTLALLHVSASAMLDRYVSQPAYDTTADGTTYFAAMLTLNDDEAAQFRTELIALVKAHLKEPSEDGRPRLLTVSVIPEAL